MSNLLFANFSLLKKFRDLTIEKDKHHFVAYYKTAFFILIPCYLFTFYQYFFNYPYLKLGIMSVYTGMTIFLLIQLFNIAILPSERNIVKQFQAVNHEIMTALKKPDEQAAFINQLENFVERDYRIDSLIDIFEKAFSDKNEVQIQKLVNFFIFHFSYLLDVSLKNTQVH